MAGDNKPRTDLCSDLNKLVTRENGKNNRVLINRPARGKILAQTGAGRDVAVEQSGGSVQYSKQTVTSSDGIFVFEVLVPV